LTLTYIILLSLVSLNQVNAQTVYVETYSLTTNLNETLSITRSLRLNYIEVNEVNTASIGFINYYRSTYYNSGGAKLIDDTVKLFYRGSGLEGNRTYYHEGFNIAIGSMYSGEGFLQVASFEGYKVNGEGEVYSYSTTTLIGEGSLGEGFNWYNPYLGVDAYTASSVKGEGLIVSYYVGFSDTGVLPPVKAP